VLLVAVVACLIAQASKLVIELIKNRKVNARFSDNWRMPVPIPLWSLPLARCGSNRWWASPEFAIATILAIIVVYDAAGVRQAAGKQARILNQIIDDYLANTTTLMRIALNY